MARYRDFKSFYAFYLQEHSRTGTRVLHFIGTTVVICSAFGAAVLGRPALLGFGVVCAYAFAWIGHFLVERNRPATFKQPLFSLIADFRLYFEILAGRQKLIQPGPGTGR